MTAIHPRTGTPSNPTRLPRPKALPAASIPRVWRALRTDIVPAFSLVFERTGSPARLTVPGVLDIVLVDRPEDVERVLLRKQDIYPKGEEYDVPALGLRQGLVTSRGERWKRDRGMLNPLFARRHLEQFADTMVARTDTLLEAWSASADGARIDVAREMMTVTLQIAAETMFGTELSDHDVATFGDGVAEVLTDMLKVGNSPLTWLLQALPGMNMAKAAGVHWRSRRIAHHIREADEMIERIITARQVATDSPTTDFLGLLLGARDEESGHTLTRTELLEQSQTFLGAGHETTATGLSWLWHLLAQNEDARDRMFDEVDTVLGGRVPTFHDVDRLPWTKACFSEAMRIHPPVYLSMRRAAADDELNGFYVKRGTIVIVLTHRLHRNPDVWPDPLRFDPSRFLPGAGVDRPKSAYVPFGGGRRICIGSQFAIMEATLIAARVSQRFVLDGVPGHRVVEEGATTLRPRGGLPMVLRRRDSGLSA